MARQAHVGATAELQAIADEVMDVVRVMDGLNRYRFRNEPDALAAWASVSNVVASPRNNGNGGRPAEDDAPAGGEVLPAA